MRIVHLILTSRFAGSERYALELANAQSQRHDVTVILHRRGAQDRPDGLLRHVGPRVRVEVVGGPMPWAVWRARQLLERCQPDVAHAHLSGGCRALRGLRHPCLRVATLHIAYKAQQHAHLDALIALTPAQLEAIPAPLRARTRQLDNWTQAAAPSPGARAAVRRAWGIADDAVLIGTLGRIEASKGHDLLLAASRPLLDEGRAQLVIVGSGRDWDAVRRLAPADVRMPGFSSQPADCLAAFDVFVSAARSEPFGLVFLEAMAAGLPIVATATEGAVHLAPRHGWRVVPVGDTEALQDALRHEVAQGQRRVHYDLQPYALDSADDAIDAFYREHLKGRA